MTYRRVPHPSGPTLVEYSGPHIEDFFDDRHNLEKALSTIFRKYGKADCEDVVFELLLDHLGKEGLRAAVKRVLGRPGASPTDRTLYLRQMSLLLASGEAKTITEAADIVAQEEFPRRSFASARDYLRKGFKKFESDLRPYGEMKYCETEIERRSGQPWPKFPPHEPPRKKGESPVSDILYRQRVNDYLSGLRVDRCLVPLIERYQAAVDDYNGHREPAVDQNPANYVHR